MTRKHFTALAEALRITSASPNTCTAVAFACAQANARFDWTRFLLACGLVQQVQVPRQQPLLGTVPLGTPERVTWTRPTPTPNTGKDA